LAAGRHGGPLLPGDFALAFAVVAAIAACSFVVFTRLPADAGAEISGHGAGLARGQKRA
jgi:hypothetical protein